MLNVNAKFLAVGEVEILVDMRPRFGFCLMLELGFSADGLESGWVVLFDPKPNGSL